MAALEVKNPPVNTGGTVGDAGSIPGSGSSLEEGMATHSSILAWSISWAGGDWQATVHKVAESQTRLSANSNSLE